jgi:energy-coupling factor transport system substrate-specific component
LFFTVVAFQVFSMQNSWQLRDFVFAAFMTIGMILSVVVVGPFIPPGLQLLAWAPLGGIFLTLGMARLQRRGSVAVMILPLALILGLISPIITLYLAATVLITEGVVFCIGNYRNKRHRLLGNVLFFGSANLIGVLLGAYLIRGAKSEPFLQFVNQPLFLLLLTLTAGIAGAVGWWLGELAVQQLRKAGKMDVDV